MVVITFVVVETILFAFYPVDFMRPSNEAPDNTWLDMIHRPSTTPGLVYELAPGKEKPFYGVNISTNSFGMRGQEPIIPDDESVCNLVAIGDSFTFGLRVAINNTYAKVLEHLLTNDSPEKTTQVLNLGVAGYSTKDEVSVIKQKAMEWNPDLIILGYVLNDPETDPIQPLHSHYHEPKWWQYTNITRLLALSIKRFEIKHYGNGDYLRYLHAPDGDKWQSVLQAFTGIQGISEKHDVPVLLVVFPMLASGIWSNYPFRDLHSQVTDAGSKSGFYTVDLYDTFSTYPPKELMVAANDPHPNALAHALAANAIFQAIKRFSLPICENQETSKSLR